MGPPLIFVISGGSLQWSEGSVGFVAKTIAEAKIGNPMMLLDEIDKANSSNKYDVLGAFYPLLEEHSAKRFKDEALDLELDATHINWVITANDVQKIPTPILSRAKLFNIELPTKQQLPSIIKNIYSVIRESEPYGKMLDENLGNEILEMFHGVSLRLIKRKLTEACGKAFLDNRTAVLVNDFEIDNSKSKKSFKVGFI